MKKTLKWSAIMLLLGVGVLIYIANLPHYDYPTRFDVVIVNGQLYFVLEKDSFIKCVRVDMKSTAPAEAPTTMWGFGYSGLDYSKYPLKRKQIKYAEKLEGIPLQLKPDKLQKLVRYGVLIDSSAGVFPGNQEFVVINDNEIIMVSPTCRECVKDRIVSVERNGKEIKVPYSVTYDNDDNKVITVQPFPEN